MPYLDRETEGQTQSDNGESGLAKGAIAGIVIGSIAGLLLIVVSLVLYLHRRKSVQDRTFRKQITHSANLQKSAAQVSEKPSGKLSEDAGSRSK